MPKDGERGFALLIVLWSIVLLTLLVTGITATGRTETRLAANLRDAAIAEAAADGATHEAAFHLLSPAEPWAADGRLRTLALPGATVSLRIVDEGGKVNPNLASRELLRALLQGVGLSGDAADALAGNIAAWRFPIAGGGSTVPGLGGAVAVSPLDAHYLAAGRDYGPPGAPFESLDELGLVLGVTAPVLDRLRPHLSLLNDREPDPSLADPAVLHALALAQPDARPVPRKEPARAVVVVAEAVTPNGARFTRRAGLRLGRAENESPLAIASWDVEPGAP